MIREELLIIFFLIITYFFISNIIDYYQLLFPKWLSIFLF